MVFLKHDTVYGFFFPLKLNGGVKLEADEKLIIETVGYAAKCSNGWEKHRCSIIDKEMSDAAKPNFLGTSHFQAKNTALSRAMVALSWVMAVTGWRLRHI